MNIGSELVIYLLFSIVPVHQMIRQDPTVMSWGLWISTLTTTSAALITAGLAALLAVLNTATSPRSKILSDPGVYFINILTRESPKPSVEPPLDRSIES